MSYKFDFNSLPFRVRAIGKNEKENEKETAPKEREIDPVVAEQLHTHTYIRRGDYIPENCTAIYHTADGDWLELDVGPESPVGQRELPDVKFLGIERIS